MSRPRLVLDTNVLVSAFLWEGAPGRLIERAGDREVQLFTSRELLDELAATLAKKKLARFVAATGLTAEQMLDHYRRICTLVTAKQLETKVSRDTDDDAVLACAMAARADLLISGDEDLLVLVSVNSIPIVSVAEAIRRLDSGSIARSSS